MVSPRLRIGWDGGYRRTMPSALDAILAEAPATLAGTDELWEAAISAAVQASPPRGIRTESPAARLRRLRDAVQGEIVAFHDALMVLPYRGERTPTMTGSTLWEVRVPLTLFPRRDHGFSRVEVLVEFSNEQDAKGVRVLELQPAARVQVMARAEMGGSLELHTRAKLGLPVPLPTGTSVVEAAAEVYGKAEAAQLTYQTARDCVLAEVVRGHGARWRLDDPRDRERFGAESHQLSAVVEVAVGAAPVHAAGYLQAYSDVNWLSASLGTVWTQLTERILAFFKRGAPAEAYAEWQGIVPADPQGVSEAASAADRAG
jgi:hypothetical protein